MYYAGKMRALCELGTNQISSRFSQVQHFLLQIRMKYSKIRISSEGKLLKVLNLLGHFLSIKLKFSDFLISVSLFFYEDW